MNLSAFLQEYDNPAILLGNGINRIQGTFPEWKELLIDLGGSDLNFKGLTYNELYDFIEIRDGDSKGIKERVCESLSNPASDLLFRHSEFLELVQSYGCPIMTTNFDLSLKHAGGLTKFRTKHKGSTHWYPWDYYYSKDELSLPTDGFAVWHLHGTIDYKESLRMGLSDYMGCVEKSRKLFHRGGSALFRGKNQSNWRGRFTWLHIWFNEPIIIVGLKLSAQEVFIRWLLIEREKYFKKFPERRKPTYFANTNDDPEIKNFLDSFNFVHLKVEKYDDLYR